MAFPTAVNAQVTDAEMQPSRKARKKAKPTKKAKAKKTKKKK